MAAEDRSGNPNEQPKRLVKNLSPTERKQFMDMLYQPPHCSKCEEEVPMQYLNGDAQDETWVKCLHQGWFCPNHSPTSNCEDMECTCCNPNEEEEEEEEQEIQE